MASLPLGSIHGRTTSGVACHHCLWEVQMVERRRAWNANITFGKHTRSNDIGRGITSTPLNSTYGQTTSGVTCYHRLWTAHTVKKHRVWLYITALGLHARSDDVGRGMTSPPLDSTHSRMMSGVACHHRLWIARTIVRRRAWHDMNALGQDTRSATSGVICHHRTWTTHTVGNVGRGMTSPPLDGTHGRTTSGVS